MSSDLPDFRFESGRDMARVLVTYMADDRAVQTAVLNEFDGGTKVDLATIRSLRRTHLKNLKRAEGEPFRFNETYYPAEQSERLAAVNKRFLEAIESERALSVELARRQGALHSPALRKPEIVNQAWDRETEMAWLQNGELRL